MRLKVVHGETGAPVAGVRLNVSSRGGSGENVEALTDDRGECRLDLPDATREFYIFYRKENFVEGVAAFGGSNKRAVPETHTIVLKPGLTVGGIVRDEEGQGVAGAKVRLTFELESGERPGQVEMAYGNAETDADGRWTFGGAPDKPTGFDVFTPHPDFVLDSFSHRLKFDRFKELRERTLVTVIRRGVTIPGLVVDDAGRPVAGAEVTADRSFGLISCAKTDDKGHFELRGVAPGKRMIAVKAEGLAPQARDVVAERGAAALELRLAKARTLRIRAVDDRGNALEGVALMVDKWGAGASPSLGVIGKTDAAGEFAWTGAPEGAVSVAGYKAGYRRAPAKALEVGAAEALIAMRAETIFKGTVVDDVTGAAIERFKLEIGATEKGRRGSMSTTRNGEGGRYEMAVPLEGDVYTIRIVADGYLPEQSGALTVAAGGGPIIFDARLKKGKPVTGVVTLADGRPAAGADVVLVDRMAPDIRNGVLSPETGRQGIVTKTDAAGAFALPPREGRLRILVIHEAGWNELRRAPDGAVERITLKPWCQVSGRLMKGAAPWAGQKVTLEPVLYATSDHSDYSLRTYFRYEVTTDAQGRFAFDRVVDEEVTLARERADHETVLALKPGDRRADLRIGGVGRPVVAKLIVPTAMKLADGRGTEGSLRLVRPVFIKPGNWEELTAAQQAKVRGEFQASAEYRQYADSVRNVALTIAADGSLRAEDVPPGEYVLSVYGLEPTPGEPTHLRMRGSADTSVVMPPAPGGRGDEPLDAGTLELREHNYLAVGSVAPAFEAATFDAGRLKLADYHGKYVLLDFWATWCGPCVTEMKHLERLHESMKADGRLVIVSVSVDDRMDEPARFLKERKLPWPQAFAGALGESSARRQFGVGAIPSIWLIDPEGKIVAKEIFGDQIDEAIGKAMKSKP